ncbi:hypothetical protein BDF21DRAFT_483547 [Thamnidium elegans]|nr:hypothetical protein BDF21DRAFT_483547 [Thamnidium elegans]
METRRKRKSKSQASSSRRRKKPSEPPPPPPPPVDKDLKTQYVNRTCKLGPLLRLRYKPYKILLRAAAEEFSLLRQDAINLTLLILIQSFNTQQVELVRRYTNIIPEIQHQLLTELLALNTISNQDNAITDSEDITTALQNLVTPINNQLDQLRPNIEEINNIAQQVHTAIAQGNLNVVQINHLHYMLNRSVTQFHPQIIDILQSITRLLQQIRQIRTQFENEITIIRGRLIQQHGIIVNVIIESRDTAYRVELGRLVFQTRLNQLQREDLTEEEWLLQAQLSTQVRIFIQNEQTHLAALRQYETQHRQTIEARNATLFQQAEIISQQLLLAVANPEGNQFFPKITNATFWSHVYRKAANDPNQLNTNIRFNQSIQRNFADFEISRKILGTEQYAYDIPALDQLHIAISSNYGTAIIQIILFVDVVMHLLNTRLWVVCIFKAKKAADGTISHRPFNEIVFREENEEEVVDELPEFVNLNELYNQIQLIYEAEFSELNYAQVNDYNNASNHPLKYIRISYRLLQVATSLPDYPIKLWSLIPEGSHSIVHVHLFGYIQLNHHPLQLTAAFSLMFYI